ncbi:MAG: response regulator [Elusimicrobia bacterium]|nr:response regulator [Elusimicrobiota bacterium]
MAPRILVADDSGVARDMIKAALAGAGYEVVGEAQHGRELADLYFRLRPDLVTLDLDMPQLGGVEALVEILMRDPRARVVVVTGFSQLAAQKQVLHLGAKAVLSKPFLPDELVQTVKNALEA